MDQRHVFSTNSLVGAVRAIEAARAAGVPDNRISLIARSDIEIEKIPTERVDATTDTIPAALRGAATGGALGLVGGLVALAIPPVGITVGGVALMSAIAAGVGAWSSALVGSSVPNSVRRRFESEIEQGRILVVVDYDDEEGLLEFAMSAVGAKTLPFDAPSAAA
jgi:hypothetical protein